MTLRRLAFWVSSRLFMVLFAALYVTAGSALAQNSGAQPDSGSGGKAHFGGPDQVDAQLETDRQPKEPFLEFGFLGPYFDFKDRLKTNSGFGFGVDYSAVYFSATESPGQNSSGGGMFRFFSSWELVGRDTPNNGAIVFKFSHRHAYTDVPPKGFGFELGYVGMMAPPFNDDELRLTNLYWRQRLARGRIAFIGGFLDATDYVDVYALASPWMHFMNLAFSTGAASIALPGDALLGLAAAAYLTDNIYAIAGFGDSNSDPTDPFNGFDTFFDQSEFFKTIELGWTTSKDRFYFDNVHLTYWHNDERVEAMVPKGWGLNFSATTYLNDKWLPFLRGGYTEDGGSLLQKSVSAGFGYQPVPQRDLIGFAANWGQPNETTYRTGLPDQVTFELFYRFQLSTRLALTPDIQYLIDPAENSESSSIWVFGMRARLAL